MDCVKEYLNLLIIQYRDKPKASEHVSAFLNRYDDLCKLYRSFGAEFDLDMARGKQLDILARIVGVNRTVDNVIPKMFFGFSEDPLSLTFGDGEFYTLSESAYTSTELSDSDLRFFIKAKIINNYTDGVLHGVDGIQEAILFLFGNMGYIVDNKDMSMTLYVSNGIREDRISYVKSLGLLPLPQGVRLKAVIKYYPGDTFGFSENPTSLTFGEGKFSEII